MLTGWVKKGHLLLYQITSKLWLKPTQRHYLTAPKVRSPDQHGCFLCSGSHKAQIKVLPGRHSFLEVLQLNLLRNSLRLLAKLGPHFVAGCQPEASLSPLHCLYSSSHCPFMFKPAKVSQILHILYIFPNSPPAGPLLPPARDSSLFKELM